MPKSEMVYSTLPITAKFPPHAQSTAKQELLASNRDSFEAKVYRAPSIVNYPCAKTMTTTRPQNVVLKNCLTHAALAGLMPIVEMPQQSACELAQSLLNEIEQELPAAIRFGDHNFQVTDGEHGDMRIRVFRLPTPEQPNEAYYLGVFVYASERRVFLLEKTQDIRFAILIEWTKTHRLNFGIVLPVENSLTHSDFASAVVEVIEDNVAPRLTIPRAPIFNTSIREFAAWSSLDSQLLETRMRSGSSGAPGSLESRFLGQREQPMQSSSPGKSLVTTDDAPKRKPWWQFWK